MVKTYIYIGALIAVLGALAGAGWYIHTNAINKQRIELVEQHNRALIRSSEATITLQLNKDKAMNELKNKLKGNDVRINALIGELSKRPKRSDPVPPSTGNSCTGARLYRDDAEFLTWYSAQTERLREERDYYSERYEEARQQLERLKNGKD